MTTHAERVPCTASHLSDFARVKVDLAQTGFFRGREYRSFKELSIAVGSTYSIKATVPANIILLGLELTLDDGWARVATVVGGTDGGGYVETLPIFNRNNMSQGPDREAVIAPTVSLLAGGIHTGGTELDVLRVRTANASGAVASVGTNSGDERGIGAGTYYFRISNLGVGVVAGVFKARWEER